MTKGADFLAEAERLRDQETARIGLTSLQGTLLLYERLVCHLSSLVHKVRISDSVDIPSPKTTTSDTRCYIKPSERVNHSVW